MHTREANAFCMGVFDNGAQGTLLGGITFRDTLVQVGSTTTYQTLQVLCIVMAAIDVPWRPVGPGTLSRCCLGIPKELSCDERKKAHFSTMQLTCKASLLHQLGWHATLVHCINGAHSIIRLVIHTCVKCFVCLMYVLR